MDVNDFKKLKVIDWEEKGNLIRLYLGAPDNIEYWGDDWDDSPYEHNAGNVYERNIVGFIDIVIGFGYDPVTPATHALNSCYSKKDFKDGIPFMAVVPSDDSLFGYESFMQDDWRAVGADFKLRLGMTVSDVLAMCDGRIATVIGNGHLYYGGAVPVEDAPSDAVPLNGRGEELVSEVKL